MADREVIVINSDAAARQQLVEDMKKLRANPLDRSVPGGYFLDPGGETAHDAHGNKVPLRSDKAIRAEVAETVKAEQAAAEPAPVVVEGEKKKSRSRAKK